MIQIGDGGDKKKMMGIYINNLISWRLEITSVALPLQSIILNLVCEFMPRFLKFYMSKYVRMCVCVCARVHAHGCNIMIPKANHLLKNFCQRRQISGLLI